MKYIRRQFKDSDDRIRSDEIYLFPNRGPAGISHRQMARLVAGDSESYKVISAGFIAFVNGTPTCTGRSESLDLGWLEDDKEILHAQLNKAGFNRQLQLTNPKKAKLIEWMVNYLVEEDFPFEHLHSLSKIIGLFNDREESEKEIFEFAKKIEITYC